MTDDDDDIAAARTLASSGPEPHARDSMQVIPTLVADRYEIVGLIGMGGMGRVYRAHDRMLDEIVALKMLRNELVGHADMLERFRREVKLARRVTSPHVVRTFDLGEHGDEHFLTMEYIEGRSLSQRIDEGPLPMDEIMRIALAIAAGIAAAHATGVLHRDLKPDNVIVAKTGRIALTDFGIASAAAGNPLATVDRFVGTPAYMAPEQVQGAAVIGPPADIYAFGTILFEMLTGRRAFVGNDPIPVAVARLTQPPPDPRDIRAGIPDAVAGAVLRCLALAPSARFADGAALEAALHGLDTTTPASTIPRASAPIVPEKSSRAVAILPLRAAADLAEVAEGLGEEIGDALSMSRGVRVRPLGALRARANELDALELGRTLGVDVVVEGSIRRRGERVRIAARVFSVADEFQLWANHIDATSDDLLSASDEIVRAIAAALTVEIAVPQRAPIAAGHAEVYLEAKAQLRAGWLHGDLRRVVTALEAALRERPDDPSLLALLALAQARIGFYGIDDLLGPARSIAERAVRIAPDSGEAQVALAYAALYTGDAELAGASFARAVKLVPGLALAQGMLGGMLLDAGELDDAVAHLEAAISIDPQSPQLTDLARAYAYLGRFDEAQAMLARETPGPFLEYLRARLARWHGKTYELRPIDPATPALQRMVFDLGVRIYRKAKLDDADTAELARVVAQLPGRWRTSLAQYFVELLAQSDLNEAAIAMIRTSVDSGLHDILWFERCPLLASLRGNRDFGELAEVVRARANAIIVAVHGALA